MTRRGAVLSIALALGLVLSSLPADAQQPAKVPRIGLLIAGTPARTPYLEGFRQGLRELGYVEGQNIVIELRAAEGKYGQLAHLAAELISLGPDVVVA